MWDGIVLGSATLLTAIVAAGQWYSSSRAAARQRDVELTRWGHSVIELMAEIETACYPISQDAAPVTAGQFEKLAERGSALADMGRLFFPNYRGNKLRNKFIELGCKLKHKPLPRSITKSDGIRVSILDEVIRASYVASHLASCGPTDRKTLRMHVWRARKSFVTLLQQEMGSALRKVGIKSAGDHVPQDPANWPHPDRQLPYSVFRRENS
jgi:hypothetical protein